MSDLGCRLGATLTDEFVGHAGGHAFEDGVEPFLNGGSRDEHYSFAVDHDGQASSLLDPEPFPYGSRYDHSSFWAHLNDISVTHG
jgi:hypothetical protein